MDVIITSHRLASGVFWLESLHYCCYIVGQVWLFIWVSQCLVCVGVSFQNQYICYVFRWNRECFLLKNLVCMVWRLDSVFFPNADGLPGLCPVSCPAYIFFLFFEVLSSIQLSTNCVLLWKLGCRVTTYAQHFTRTHTCRLPFKFSVTIGLAFVNI